MSDQSLLDSTRIFAARELAPQAAEIDLTGELPAGRWASLGEFGLAGLQIPAELGGLGADRQTALAALEIVAGACASTAWALLAHMTVSAGILALGTDEQKKCYLPGLAQARLIGGALAATETGGGSNAASIRTFARREGDEYVLDGGKFFISQAGAGDVYLVMARTDRNPGPNALSSFIVEKTDPGLGFGEREQTMGIRGVAVREIFFENCRIPADRLLGTLGGALALIGAIGATSVLGAAAAATGIAQAAVDVTIAHLRERTVLDQPLSAIGAIQARMARVLLELEGARAWVDRGLARVENPQPGPPLPVWMAKIGATEAAAHIIDQCLALHGAIGYSQALPMERHCRDIRAFGIHWGNNDVFLDMIGKTITG